MPRFVPFPALRFAQAPYAEVIAPPYDVLSEADAEDYRQQSPHNVVHIDVPAGPDRYTCAGDRFRDWLADGVLAADPKPTLTVYRMRFTDPAGQQRTISGVLGGLEVVDEGAGGVLPHERTTPKASTDRLDLTRATRANLSPVWGLSLAGGLTGLLEEPGESIATVHDDTEIPSGVQHSIERIDHPDRIAAIADLIGSDDVLLADGHHRYGVARSYRDEVRAATGRSDTPAEETLAFVGELVADQLSVAAIHRLYTGIGAAEVRAALEHRFDAAPIDRPTPDTLARMEADGFLALVTAEGCWALTPKPGAFDGVRRLDGQWLETTLEGTGAEVTYQHGVADALAAVDSGAASAAVLIRPVGVTEIERTAREGVLMPPKSTFFTPKLKTGFVFRALGD